MVKISKKVYSELVRITLDEKPNEASAFLFNDNTIVIKAKPKSKTMGSFDEIDPVWVSDLTDKYGKPSALFHSHPCSAIPSRKDLMFMVGTIGVWGCIWLIMSDQMNLRAWTINKTLPAQRGQTLHAVELEVKLDV